jgi:predicted glycosyltransferase
MTVEAVLLGKPAISSFPGEKPLYIRYLEKHGLVKTIHSPRKIVNQLEQSLSRGDVLDRQRQRGTQLLMWMENPARKIFTYVRKAAQGGF